MDKVVYSDSQEVRQLEERQGGYMYLEIPADVVNSLEKGKKSRFICTVKESVSFQCGLSHLGNGNFFIILSKDRRTKAQIALGDTVPFVLQLDPNPLGAEIPESLEVLLNQDEDLKEIWDTLTDGKKRSVIHAVSRIKSIDLQISRSIEFIQQLHRPN